MKFTEMLNYFSKLRLGVGAGRGAGEGGSGRGEGKEGVGDCFQILTCYPIDCKRSFKNVILRVLAAIYNNIFRC